LSVYFAAYGLNGAFSGVERFCLKSIAFTTRAISLMDALSILCIPHFDKLVSTALLFISVSRVVYCIKILGNLVKNILK